MRTMEVTQGLQQSLVDFTVNLYNYRDCSNKNNFRFGSLFVHSTQFDDNRRSETQKEHNVNTNERDDGDVICHIYGDPRNAQCLKNYATSFDSAEPEQKEQMKNGIGVCEFRRTSQKGVELGSFRVIINFTKDLWTFAICVKNDLDSDEVAYLEWKDRYIESSEKYESLKKLVLTTVPSDEA